MQNQRFVLVTFGQFLTNSGYFRWAKYFLDTWHVPQDWPRRPGIVRHMEFCAKRIIQPMNTIKKNAPHLIEPDYMKTHKIMNQIRREYDQLSEVCLTWARQNYLSWFNNVDNKVRIALRAPLLIRCPETKKFYVNYDPEIDKILREAKYFERIGEQFEHAKGTVQNVTSSLITEDIRSDS